MVVFMDVMFHEARALTAMLCASYLTGSHLSSPRLIPSHLVSSHLVCSLEYNVAEEVVRMGGAMAGKLSGSTGGPTARAAAAEGSEEEGQCCSKKQVAADGGKAGPVATGSAISKGKDAGRAVAAADGSYQGSWADLSFLELTLLMAALCFHAVFEGLAIGLSSTVADMWALTITIVLHKVGGALLVGQVIELADP